MALFFSPGLQLFLMLSGIGGGGDGFGIDESEPPRVIDNSTTTAQLAQSVPWQPSFDPAEDFLNPATLGVDGLPDVDPLTNLTENLDYFSVADLGAPSGQVSSGEGLAAYTGGSGELGPATPSSGPGSTQRLELSFELSDLIPSTGVGQEASAPVKGTTDVPTDGELTQRAPSDSPARGELDFSWKAGPASPRAAQPSPPTGKTTGPLYVPGVGDVSPEPVDEAQAAKELSDRLRRDLPANDPRLYEKLMGFGAQPTLPPATWATAPVAHVEGLGNVSLQHFNDAITARDLGVPLTPNWPLRDFRDPLSVAQVEQLTRNALTRPPTYEGPPSIEEVLVNAAMSTLVQPAQIVAEFVSLLGPDAPQVTPHQLERALRPFPYTPQTEPLGEAMEFVLQSAAGFGLGAAQAADAAVLAARGTVLGAKATAISKARVALDIEAVATAEEAAIRFHDSVRQAEAFLRAHPDMIDKLGGRHTGAAVSIAQLGAAAEKPAFARALSGNAMEALVDAINTAHPATDAGFTQVGGAYKIDFTGWGRYEGLTFELTTEAAVPAHAVRPYVREAGAMIFTYTLPLP